jgi:hypothetical protein
MAKDTTITSANSVFTIIVPGLFPAPVQMYGYAVDKAFMVAAADVSETMMGVDGRMSAGFTPTVKEITISLQADSPSRFIFTTMEQAMQTSREIFFITAEIVLPATNEKYSLIRGVLKNAQKFPAAQKVLQPMDFVTHWESINVSVL